MFRFFLLSTLLITLLAQAQGYPDLLRPETLKLQEQATSCWNRSQSGCMDILRRAYRLSQAKKGDCAGCIEVEIARLHIFDQRYDSAAHYLRYARKSLSGMDYNDPRVKFLDAEILGLTAMSFYNQDLLDSTLYYLQANIRVIDAAGDAKAAAFARMNLASVYSSVNDYATSIKHNLEAFKEIKKYKDTRLAVLAGNLATDYQDAGKIDSAQIWARRSIKWGMEYKHAGAQTRGFYILAASLAKTLPDSALVYANRSVDLASLTNRSDYLAKARLVKADVLFDLGKFEEARAAYALARESFNVNTDYLSSTKGLALSNLKLGNNKEGLAYLQEYFKQSDSINFAGRQRMVLEFESRYELEKKERTLAQHQLNLHREQTQKRYLIAGFGLLAAVAGGAFVYNRKVQKLRLARIGRENLDQLFRATIRSEENERRRISNMLHDSVAAKLAAAKMSLQALPFLDSGLQTDRVEKTAQLISSIHADVRNVAHQLLPITLEKEGLEAAVMEFASEMNSLNLVNFSVSTSGCASHTLPEHIRLIVFRIVQELMNNVVKHAKASKAQIVFVYTPGQLEISVADNGIGFTAQSEGQGLYSIRERVSRIGGTFSIKGLDSGTVAVITLSLQDNL